MYSGHEVIDPLISLVQAEVQRGAVYLQLLSYPEGLHYPLPAG